LRQHIPWFNPIGERLPSSAFDLQLSTMTRLKTLGWIAMTLLAGLTAWYAINLFLAPTGQTRLVKGLLSTHPVIAPLHFVGGAIALLSGAPQLHAALRTRYLIAHRWIGRLYLVAVLSASLAGLTLARDSSGGNIAHFGFGFLAASWFVVTLLAYRCIRQGDVRAHRCWVIRSYALTLAAVTLRLYIPASQALSIPIDLAYPVIAWLCWVPNLFAAEWFIGSEPAIVPPLIARSAKTKHS
jgi:hypothetical protein